MSRRAKGAPPFHLVLFEPEIPPNTGNLVRTCAATGCWLHLIHPLGFSVDDRALRRAGLDYWAGATVLQHPDFASWLGYHRGLGDAQRIWYFSGQGALRPTQVHFGFGDALVFGPETRGLPLGELPAEADRVLRLPMRPETRSLNLASAATAALYLALAQLDFPGME